MNTKTIRKSRLKIKELKGIEKDGFSGLYTIVPAILWNSKTFIEVALCP